MLVLLRFLYAEPDTAFFRCADLPSKVRWVLVGDTDLRDSFCPCERFTIKIMLRWIVGCTCLMLTSLLVSEPAFGTERPNVLVIVTDDQGWGDLSFSGNSNLSTPNIDSLASQGASFDRFFVCPVCSPTRAEFLTGRYHPRGGVFDVSLGGERLNLDQRTIADWFQAAGYRTAAFGKWHNGTQYPYHPCGRGFKEFYGYSSGHWGDYFSPPLDHNGRVVRGNGYLVDDFTDHAIEFIEADCNQPFFVYLPLPTPHSPMQVPDSYWNRFKDKALTMLGPQGSKENLNFTRAALAMVECIDDHVGRLLKRLDELDLADNTIVLFFSDNGPNSDRWNGGMKGRKGSTDEGGVRSPLFMRWPAKIEAGKRLPQICGAIDLLPTLADLAGIPIDDPRPFDGLSLRPLLEPSDPSWPDRKLYSHWAGKVSVRTQRYRLDHQGKLFDMQADPSQLRPCNQRYPEVAAVLHAAVDAWKSELLADHHKVERPYPVGHRDFKYTQLPARDGTPFGTIARSAKAPNCSYFTNWTTEQDKVVWPIDLLDAGRFEVELHYTCPASSVGTEMSLQFGEQRLDWTVSEAHDPPAYGAEHDRVPRDSESYMKASKAVTIGEWELPAGRADLTLQAVKINGSAAPEVHMLQFKRLD